MTYDDYLTTLKTLPDEQVMALADRLLKWRDDAAIDAKSVHVKGDVFAYLARLALKMAWLLSSAEGRAVIEDALVVIEKECAK